MSIEKKLFSVSGGIKNQSGWFLEKLKLKQFCSVFVKDKKNLIVLIWLLSLKIAINERKLNFLSLCFDGRILDEKEKLCSCNVQI